MTLDPKKVAADPKEVAARLRKSAQWGCPVVEQLSRPEVMREAADVMDQQAARVAELEAHIEELKEGVWLRLGECLAGQPHSEISPDARAKIKRTLERAFWQPGEAPRATLTPKETGE
jgi:cell division protein FtsB